jgi:putative transposase
MSEDISSGPLTEILRRGARRLPAEALDAEISLFLDQYRDQKDDAGRQRIVRSGFHKKRDIQSGIGPISVKAPRARDRHPEPSERVHFSSALLPPYLRKTKSLEEFIPRLYLKGVSAGDFTEALTSLLGKDAPGLPPSTVSRLKESRQKDPDE